MLAFAIANRRLPCPAAPSATGVESPAGGTCTNPFDGFLPAESIGFPYYDSERYALDAYNNRIRYAVSAAITGCSGSSTLPHFTSAANLKANGMSCRPNDLDVCTRAQGASASSCASRSSSRAAAPRRASSTARRPPSRWPTRAASSRRCCSRTPCCARRSTAPSSASCVSRAYSSPSASPPRAIPARASSRSPTSARSRWRSRSARARSARSRSATSRW